MVYLTKSLYVNGLQCPKLLWIKCNNKDIIPKPDESTQHLFDQGKQVGELARTLFRGGQEIKAEYWELAESDKKSREALKLRKPLFEAGFIVGELYSRADVLLPVGKSEWDLVEVKSGSSIKEENIHDVSFQRYVYEKAGLKIRKCFIMHINSDYVRRGKINLKKLFAKEDVTDKVKEFSEGIEARIDEMLKVMKSKTMPNVKIGPQCNKFYGCDLKDFCWGKVPLNSVLNLMGSSATAFELYDSGVKDMKDIPENFELGEKQLVQHHCAKSGQPCIHKEKIKSFLNTLKYPLYFMDFETYATAIPLYNGLKPYQPIPFQFSVHIIEKEGDKPKHFSFIASGTGDPRKQFIEELKKVLGKEGSILVYYQSFEKSRLEEIGKLFPKHKAWIKSIFERIVDLIIPFSSFAYYNSKQMGSASLKYVLPALTGKSYKGMDIAEGQMASLSYLYITHGTIDGKKATADEVKKIRRDLEQYCGLDTEGMIWILEKLRKISA